MNTLSNSRRARAVSASPVQPGDVVAGKYRVERVIAAGGMGVVVSARHEVLKQVVAIKFLIPQAMEEHTTARFLREAKAAARIQSERVVRVYDCGTLDSGVPYMVMEHLVGIDLAQHIRSTGAMAGDEAVDLICSALEGVAEAHALGIVHRDLKPANLFLVGAAQRPYSVKVLDFGISKIQRGPDAPVEDDLTGTAVMLGSPRYVSPEQARSSADVDVRADVWSIGVILYELLDGRCPFAGDTIGEVLTKILLHDPPRLDEKRADIPSGLSVVIKRCLERDAESRYANVVELARALAPFGSELARFHVQRIERIFDLPHEPAPAISSPGRRGADAESEPTRITDSGLRSAVAADAEADPSASSAVGQRTEGAWTQAEPPERRNRTGLALIALVAAVGAGALARWIIVRQPSGEQPADTAHADPSSAPAPPPTTGLDAASTQQPAAPPDAGGSAAGSDAGAAPTGAPSTSRPRTTVAAPPRPVPKATATPKGVLDRSD